MFTCCAYGARRGSGFLHLQLLGTWLVPLLVVSGATLVSAEDDVIVRVEQDWKLEVSIPDPGTNAPQVSTYIAPTNDVEYGYAEFDVNHHSQPDYVPGGLQLQAWSGGQPIIVNNDPNGGVITQPNETITWTQSMSLSNGVLTFAVRNGRSTTWGVFGDDGRLTIRANAPLENLNGYSTNDSLKNSGVGYASNRVKSLQIVVVRRYTADGRVLTDETARTIFSQPTQ